MAPAAQHPERVKFRANPAAVAFAREGADVAIGFLQAGESTKAAVAVSRNTVVARRRDEKGKNATGF